MTRDGGKTWKNVTPKDMPDFGRVSIIDASAFDAGTAYVAVKKPLLDDFAPYLFRTHDFGATWTKIVTGIRADDYAHAVREDPTRSGLLYAGTQHGLYFSYDDGDHWQPLSLNLPDMQVCDLIVRPTTSRFRRMGAGSTSSTTSARCGSTPRRCCPRRRLLFKPDAAIRSAGGGDDPYLLRKPAQSLKIEVVDAKGTVVQTFGGSTAAAAAEAAGGGRGGGGGGGGGRGGGGGPPRRRWAPGSTA